MGSGDICFSGSSFAVVVAMVTTMTTALSTVFGLLMLSYRGRIQSAEMREAKAGQERNEALWRLQETRQRYRSFAEEQEARVLPEGRAGSAW